MLSRANPARSRRRDAAWLVLGLTALSACGCGAKWEAVPEGRQVAILDQQGIVEERAGLIVAARPLRLSFADNDEIVAFTVEITNRRAKPIEVRLDQFALLDEQGRLRRPMQEETLKRRFEVGDETYADARGLSGLAMADVGWGGVLCARFRPFRYHRHHYHHYGYYGYHYPYASYYRYWGPYWYPGYEYWYYDDRAQVAAERREVARFLSETWNESTLVPDEVGTGHVLFAQPTREGDEVTLIFNATPPSERDEQPQAEQPVEFAFRFVRKR